MRRILRRCLSVLGNIFELIPLPPSLAKRRGLDSLRNGSKGGIQKI